MAFIDYYKIMGIPKDTPQKDIKTAYKKRAKQFHPDLHPDDPKAKAKFQALNEAYDVLNDPEKRAKYDQYGEHWKNVGDFGNGAQGGSGFEGFDFSQFGGGGFSDFFQEMFGGRRTTSGRHGFSSFGGFDGRHANGYSESFNPFGTQSGYADSEYHVKIDMYTALLGGEIIVQTPQEKLKLKVKAGTQPGTKVRLKGKGNILPDGSRGNIILTYDVELPSKLNDRQKELLQEMRVS